MIDPALATSEGSRKPATTVEDEFGPIVGAIGRRYFDGVRFPPEAEADLRRLHEQGFVVHVMRSTSWVNYLYLTWALIQRGLPPVRAVVNLRRWFTRPWRRTAQRGDVDVRFTYARRHGGSGLVFLRRSALGLAEGRQSREDPFPALVALARKGDRPVFLVPELFVWEKWTKAIRPRLLDRIFGSPDVPGFLHSVVAFLRNHKRAQFRVGEPVDLRKYVTENPDQPDELIARKVRGALHQHLARENRAVFGPPRKPAKRIIEETLRDRVLRRALDEHAAASGRKRDSVERHARRDLKAIAARPNPTVVALTSPLLNWVFNRLYDGIEVDEVGLERAMRAATRAPLVLVPSHKSHVDYLVMSSVLWNRGYNVPIVAAGANLSFWPLGPFLRRGGAFFLRRSFKDDKVYSAAFRAYVKKLVHDGITQEFFPEGGRSRTGKLLPARLGLFTWQVDAILEGAQRDLVYVPVAIDYEKVVESSSYSKELAGGEKKPEDLKALLSAPKVLSGRYGRIHVTFDEPVSVAQLAASRGVPLDEDLPDEDRKGLVRALGHRVMWGIGRVSTITPQALICAGLLAWRGRGIEARALAQRMTLLRRLAEADGTPLSSSLRDAPSDPTVFGPIQDALRTFCRDGAMRLQEARGETVYLAVEERRAELSFYKNTLMNWIAPRSLVANAVIAAGPGASREDLQQRALFLSRLFKLEFIYRVGTSFDAIFEENLASMEKVGLLEAEPGAREQLEFLADLMRDYLESYLIATLTLEDVARAGSCEKKAFSKLALEVGRSEFLAGRVTAAEAVSRTNLDNALAWFLDRQLLIEENKKVRLGPAGEDAAERTKLVAELRSFLRR